MSKKKKPFKSYLTFRKRRNEVHPQLIVGADKYRFNSMQLTHSSTNSRRNNFVLYDNPNPNDSSPAFLRKDIKKDYKFNYSRKFNNYNLSPRDYKRVDDYIKQRIKRKRT